MSRETQRSSANIKIANRVTANPRATHMKARVARYYATAYAWYAYDATLMSKIGQPENLLHIHGYFFEMLARQPTDILPAVPAFCTREGILHENCIEAQSRERKSVSTRRDLRMFLRFPRHVKISCLPLRERMEGNVSADRHRSRSRVGFRCSLALSLFFRSLSRAEAREPRDKRRSAAVTARWSSAKREKGGKEATARERERERGGGVKR